MFDFLKGKKTYFVSYTIQLDRNDFSLSHATVTINYRKSKNHLGDVIDSLAKEHGCLKKQIVVTAFNAL